MRYFRKLQRSVYVSSMVLAIAPALLIPAVHAAKTAYVDGYSLAFVDADIRRVVDAVLGSMLNVDYTLDPDISGNITLRTTNPVPAEQLIPLLGRALANVDAVIVEREGAYFVVPRKKAKALAAFVQPDRENEPQTNAKNAAPAVPSGYASESIILQFVGAEELSKIATDIVGPDIIEVGAAGSNELIIRGTLEERDAARKLITRFDVDNLANMNFEIWKLEDVDAETIVSELETIFQPPYDIIGSRIRLIPLPRLRSILAIAPDRRDISRIEPWVRKLDQGGSAKRKLYNYAVQNGRARDMARSLQLVLAGSASGSNEDGPSIPQNRTTTSQSSFGTEQSVANDTGSGGFQPPARNQFSTNAVSSGGLRIVPNEQNNSLLIYANGEEYGFIRDALDKIDQPVAQVLIEATLAEVTLTDDLRYGVDFQAIAGIGSTETTFTNSNNNSGVPAASFPGFAVSVIGKSANGVLNTLQSRTNVRVLSAPKLLTLNNEPATLQVGDQVPIVIQQAQSVGSPGAPLVNTIELRDTGVILQVTPRINDSGTIILDISQEVSDVASTTTSGINSPTIQQRRLTSTVATRSGQMVALGGLIRNRQTREKAGVPLLSQIPVVGGLFGRKVDTGSRTELIILITPTIIRSPDEVKNAVDALINGLDLTRPLLDEAQKNLIGPKLSADTDEINLVSENDYAEAQGQ